MLLIRQLTVAHVVMRIGNKSCIHVNVNDYDFKTSKKPQKIWKCEIILKEKPTVLQNLLLLPVYN